MSNESDRLQLLKDILKKHHQKLLMYFNPKKQLSLDTLDVKDLARTVMKWGKLSAQGLVCGILGCSAEPDNICDMCNCHYCSEHIPWHFHSVTNTGILEKDSSEVIDGT